MKVNRQYYRGRHAGHAEIVGDVVMLTNEANPVLKTLRSQNLNAVAIHDHMLSVEQPIDFLQCWARGPLTNIGIRVQGRPGSTGHRNSRSGHTNRCTSS